MGRIRRLLQQERIVYAPADLMCPLCERKIPLSQRDAHHLVPKSKGGRQTEYLHRICHRQIHALFTETELARQFNSVEALSAHPDIASFVAWVKTKPDDFMERTRKSQRLRAR
jgi:5-methylcytosine-specific restriction endonuclease McrA